MVGRRTNTARDPQTVRGFWHGSKLGPYQLLCLRSFVDHGHKVEVFTYEDDLGAPDWVMCRSADEIWPTENVLSYQSGFGRGSFSLHSNLFRYALLHRIGGWWIDLDVVLLSPELTNTEFFFGEVGQGSLVFTSVLKFPQRHPLLTEAIERALSSPDTVPWGTTGPFLLTELVDKHALRPWCQPMETAYPLQWFEALNLFDPSRCADVRQKCAGAVFVHLYNELWRGSGIPRQLGPPEGSYLDCLFAEHDFGFRFPARMDYADVQRWIVNRNDRIRLESEVSAEQARCQALEVRCRELSASCDSIKKERDTILASKSWRVTWPLRALRRAMRTTW
jgi:hypothetical protein